jgi:GT2 family glycosyltransferase
MRSSNNKKGMNVSIILVSYNTKELTLQCLNSIYDKTKGLSFEVFVVDNASSDGSQKAISEVFPQVKLISNVSNLGFGRANNIAIKLSTAKYIFLLNTDTILINNAVKIFYDYMEAAENTSVACCGGSLFDGDYCPQVSYGNFPSLNQILFEFGLKRIFSGYYKKSLSVDCKVQMDSLPIEVAYVSGADMFLRKSALDQAGVFDEDFFLYYEETELSFRLNKFGYRSKIIPEAHIIHLVGKSSSNSASLSKIEIMERSKYLFFRKCYGKTDEKLAKVLYSFKNLVKAILKRDFLYFRIINLILKI